MSSSTATSQLTKSAVTLKGSAQIVAEFFDYGINSILYQRGIYPPGIFHLVHLIFALVRCVRSVERGDLLFLRYEVLISCNPAPRACSYEISAVIGFRVVHA